MEPQDQPLSEDQPTTPSTDATPPPLPPPGYGPPPGYTAPQPPNYTQPGVMPPGYPPQQGFAPPPGYYPPPGMGYPPPGYAQPGTVLPGYPSQPGYPPPGYVPPGYPPQMGYPPPGYVPPPVAQQFQPVPPASGSLFQAWVKVATRPTRENFAAWSQAGDRSWVTTSIAVSTAIIFVAGVLSAIVGLSSSFLPSFSSFSTNAGVQPLTLSPVTFIVSAIEAPISYVMGVLAVAFGLALFMPEAYGPLGARFQRVLKPWALAQPGITVVRFIVSLISGVLAFALIGSIFNTINNASSNPSVVFGPVLAVGCVSLLLTVPSLAYYITMLVQSGSVGSNMSRWAVFGIALLAGIASSIALAIVFIPFSLFSVATSVR